MSVAHCAQRSTFRTSPLPALALAGLLPLMSTGARAADDVLSFSNSSLGKPPAAWHFVTLPNKPDQTSYSIVDLDGRHALKVEAKHSYGNLATELNQALTPKATLQWQWRVDQLIKDADITSKSGDDFPAKLCLSFGLPSDKLSFGERTKLSLAQVSLGTDIPTETLCYIWDNKLPVGTAMPNAFTGRIQQIVLRSGEGSLGKWLTEKRDVVADYLKLFGKESGGTVPPVTGLIIGADGDNTGDSSLAYFGDIKLEP